MSAPQETADHKGIFARCSANTRALRVSKEALYPAGFPDDQSRALVDQWFQPDKFAHLAGQPNLVFLPAPSTSGLNNLPLFIARKLQAAFGGEVAAAWAYPQAVRRTATLSGIDKLRTPPRYTLDRDTLSQLPAGATLVLVDDVVTTGGSIEAMRETLAQDGRAVAHVASLAQSDMRQVRAADITRITAKLGDPSLQPDVARVLAGRLKHFANYIELSIRKNDATRNDEISAYFRTEAERLRELGNTHAGAVLGIEGRLAGIDGLQSGPRSSTELDAGFPGESRSVRSRANDRPGRPPLSPSLNSLLDQLDELRADFTTDPAGPALASARDAGRRLAGPDLTKCSLQLAAEDYVTGAIDRANLESRAIQHDLATQLHALQFPSLGDDTSAFHDLSH